MRYLCSFLMLIVLSAFTPYIPQNLTSPHLTTLLHFRPFGSMEGEGGYNNPLELISSNFSGYINDVSYGAGNDPDQQLIAAHGTNQTELTTLPLPQWFHSSRTPQNYFEFLATNPTFLEEVSTANLLESVPFPRTGTNFVEGVSEIQRELAYESLDMASGSKPADPSLHMDAYESKLQSYLLNTDIHEASPKVTGLSQHNEGKLVNKLKNSNQIHAQNHRSPTQEPFKGIATGVQINPRAKVPASAFVSKPHHNVSRTKASTSDLRRRKRIAERLDALQNLLPQSGKMSQAATMNGIIDLIKSLQLELKELSRSKLGSESASGPFLFHEGHGRYFIPEKVTNEQFEEMMGKLLKENPSAAVKLLESKGLFLMPVALADSYNSRQAE